MYVHTNRIYDYDVDSDRDYSVGSHKIVVNN